MENLQAACDNSIERVQATCRPELPHAHRGGTWSREVRIGTDEDANGVIWVGDRSPGRGGSREVEIRAVRQGGGREERMRLRSARASRGREDLWRKASCTERKRSQERAIFFLGTGATYNSRNRKKKPADKGQRTRDKEQN